MISRYETLSLLVSSISREISKLSANEMKRFGLRGSWAKYLIAMVRHGVPLTAAKLSSLTGRDKADTSRAVAELTECGMIYQSGNEKYRTRLALTEKGEMVGVRLSERAYALIGYTGAEIADEDREIFYRSLKSISARLKEINSGKVDPCQENQTRHYKKHLNVKETL